VTRAVVVAVLCALAGPAAAQDPTAAELRQARALYDRLELERAVRVLRGIVAPNRSAPVGAAQHVEALQYLGASLVLLGQPDSAVRYFRLALERDPFLDLSSDEFTPAQVGALSRARRETFAMATRPVTGARVDPRTERIRFPFATTHAADVRAELRRQDTVLTVFEVSSQGPGELVWDGLAAARLAPPGRYELRVRATSRLQSRTDSASTYFDLRHELEPLEDTLAPLADLLPERTGAATGLSELGKGAAVAAGVVAIAGPMSSGALGRGSEGQPVLVAGVALAAGIVAFIAQRRVRDIPDNIRANEERRSVWRARQDSIRARNAQRVAATALVIAPAAGVGP
jgi:hypothetical protein